MKEEDLIKIAKTVYAEGAIFTLAKRRTRWDLRC